MLLKFGGSEYLNERGKETSIYFTNVLLIDVIGIARIVGSWFFLFFVDDVFDFLCELEEPGCDLDAVFVDMFAMFPLAFLKLSRGLFWLLDIRAELVLSLFFLVAERDERRGMISSSLDINPFMFEKTSNKKFKVGQRVIEDCLRPIWKR